jgi:hypothetical protein
MVHEQFGTHPIEFCEHPDLMEQITAQQGCKGSAERSIAQTKSEIKPKNKTLSGHFKGSV